MFWRRLRVFNTSRRPIMHLHHWLKPPLGEPGSPLASDGGKLLQLICGKAHEIATEFSNLLSDD
eukprot:803423-Alexandrium_andersonii.AAC.1